MLVASVWASAVRQGTIQVSGLSSFGSGNEVVLRYRHGNTDRPRGPRAIVLALVITLLREASGRAHAAHAVRTLRAGIDGLWLAGSRPAAATSSTRRQGTGGGRRAAAGRGQRGRGARPRKVVLAWADTRNGQAQHDSASHALAVIERLGYESGAYDTFIRTDSNIVSKKPLKTTGEAASGGPSLANVDAIFFMGHRDVPLDDAQKAELLSFVRDEGKGFVAAHVGLTALESWPELASCSAPASTATRSTGRAL